jgi:hypothetical protein
MVDEYKFEKGARLRVNCITIIRTTSMHCEGGIQQETDMCMP